MEQIKDILEEIQAICIGADSPDANKNAVEDPVGELANCQEDIAHISNLVSKLQEMIGE